MHECPCGHFLVLGGKEKERTRLQCQYVEKGILGTRQEKEYSPKRGINSSKQGWGYSSMAKYLNSTYKALDSLSSTGKEKTHTHTTKKVMVEITERGLLI